MQTLQWYIRKTLSSISSSFFLVEIIFSADDSISTTEFVFSFDNNTLLQIRSDEGESRINVFFEGDQFLTRFVDQNHNTLIARYDKHKLIEEIQLSSSTEVISSIR